jgi:hypothetical protein
MATAKQIRDAIVRVAARAHAEHPTDIDARARCFVARLSGSMDCFGEATVDSALWGLLSNDPAPRQPVDGA